MGIPPIISVVMTAFNGERFIKEAIDSILGQSFDDFEFIIVDNASKDNTKEIIRSYIDKRIILIENQENLGQTKALNIGIKKSKGDFIARMDADDISMPERLRLQLDFLNKNNSIAVVGCWHEEIDEYGKHIKYFKLPVNPLEIKCYLMSPGELAYYSISHSTTLMRRNALLNVGLYNEAYRTQDYDLWVRMIRSYKLANLNQFLVKHRSMAKQQSKEFKKEVELECERIIISNINFYLPDLNGNKLISLARMFQYKPQKTKEDGRSVLDVFDIFFKNYTQGETNKQSLYKIKSMIVMFYLWQIFKTNQLYAFSKLTKTILRNPEFIINPKAYKKLIKSILN